MPDATRHRYLLLAAMMLIVVPAVGRAATVCGPTDDPCVVQASVTFDDPVGETIAIGSRALVIPSGVTIRTVAGPLSIQAGSVVVAAGAQIMAAGPTAGQAVTIAASAGDIEVRAGATIDLSGSVHGETLSMTADGDIVVGGRLVARSGKFGSSGTVVLDSVHGNVSLNGARPVDLTAGTLGDAGVLQVTAESGGIVVNGRVILAGNAAGTIVMRAATTIVTAPTGRMSVNGTGDGGVAGEIDLIAGGGVSVAGLIDARGHSGKDGSGDGGLLAITADSLTLAAPVRLSGASPDGFGGELDVTAGDVTISGRVDATGKGSDGCGGDIRVIATRTATLGSIDVSGGACEAGVMMIQGDGRVTLQGPIVADGLRADGFAGLISVHADDVIVAGPVHANAPFGSGVVALHGCSLTVQSGAEVTTAGAYGANTLDANGAMTIAGPVVAGGSTCSAGANKYRACHTDADCQPGLCVQTGSNTIAYADPLQVPVVSASVSPPAVPTLTSLGPCTAP